MASRSVEYGEQLDVAPVEDIVAQKDERAIIAKARISVMGLPDLLGG